MEKITILGTFTCLVTISICGHFSTPKIGFRTKINFFLFLHTSNGKAGSLFSLSSTILINFQRTRILPYHESFAKITLITTSLKMASVEFNLNLCILGCTDKAKNTNVARLWVRFLVFIHWY